VQTKLVPEDSVASTASATGLVGVGYQGCQLDGFVAELVAQRVRRLVDVRLTPISRKPGFSKTRLREAVESAGITYEHQRELGNPKDNRPSFTADESQLELARAMYRSLLRAPGPAEAVHRLVDLARRERVALLCFEADQSRCHRDLILAEAEQLRVTRAGSTRHRC
jgi:uncharacterized protein (DUF488 family)